VTFCERGWGRGGSVLGGGGDGGQVLGCGGEGEGAEAFGGDGDGAGLDELGKLLVTKIYLEVIVGEGQAYSTAQVIDQIVRILNANTQPDDVLGHVALAARLLVDGGVAHAARHADERVDAAE
jgi:hypothetical protein